MNSARVSYTKQSNGKYNLVIRQGDVIMYNGYRSGGTPEQVELGKKLVAYLQRKADMESKKNPNFKWKNIKDFRSFAGSHTIDDFLTKLDAGELDYLE